MPGVALVVLFAECGHVTRDRVRPLDEAPNYKRLLRQLLFLLGPECQSRARGLIQLRAALVCKRVLSVLIEALRGALGEKVHIRLFFVAVRL